MKVHAEASLYPLRTPHVGDAVAKFIRGLRAPGIDVEVASMSTHISGESKEVFAALHAAFARLAEEHQVVLTVKLSNACPEATQPQQSERKD